LVVEFFKQLAVTLIQRALRNTKAKARVNTKAKARVNTRANTRVNARVNTRGETRVGECVPAIDVGKSTVACN